MNNEKEDNMRPWTYINAEEGGLCIVWAVDEASAVREGQRITAIPGYVRAAGAHDVAYEHTTGEMADALKDVICEREKQRAKWGDAHDDGHEAGELAQAAAYLASYGGLQNDPPDWAYALDARHDVRGRYVIAAALLLAEIERIDRAAR